MREFGLYIHVPFCKKKCSYCDFVSYAGKEDLIDEYVDKIIEEILNSSLGIRHSSLKSIYFGGGTPTLLEPRHFDKIISTLISHSSFVISHSEITIESNPGTADKTKLKELRKLGFNRLSIGAQSFNDRHLRTLGRIHNSEDIYRIYHNAREAGFDNINLDLIFALPNQTLEEWKKDLDEALKLKPEHLSTYNLQIEEGTPLWDSLSPHLLSPSPSGRGGIKGGEGFLILPTEDTELAMYEHTIETLAAAGYHHYEISNFAKPGFECQHNINYWKNGNYLGVGAGAHSHVNGKRWANPDSVEEYLSRDDRRMTMDDTGIVTDRRESIFMGLRLLEGLEIDKFLGFEKEVAELIENDLLMRENNHYKLTRQGLYLANEVFKRFI